MKRQATRGAPTGRPEVTGDLLADLLDADDGSLEMVAAGLHHAEQVFLTKAPRDILAPTAFVELYRWVRLAQIDREAARPRTQGFLTIAETAEYLCVDQRTVQRRIKAGTIPARKMGRRVLIPRAVLDNAA